MRLHQDQKLDLQTQHHQQMLTRVRGDWISHTLLLVGIQHGAATLEKPAS